MERMARGDEEAARLLVRRWEGSVFAFLHRMLGSVEEAQDLGQETFIRVYREAWRYKAEGRFRSWLFRIAGNLARDSLRRRKIVSWVPFIVGAHDKETAGNDPSEGLEREERASKVRSAIAKLPPRQRQAVILRNYQDMSYSEIAETMKVTLPAVESLLQRGMAALRRELVTGETGRGKIRGAAGREDSARRRRGEGSLAERSAGRQPQRGSKWRSTAKDM